MTGSCHADLPPRVKPSLRPTQAASVGEVELATLRWVHWWNIKRLHEALDYATPQEVETEYYLTQPINTGP
ncbi:integrase core domain-containing protein [Corynebacterium camporealensis]